MQQDVDYGPLTSLIGTWTGDKGLDVSPEPDGIENNAYRESMVFEAIDDLSNAEEQTLAVVQYRQKVFRIRDGKRIHDQTGYWSWDALTGDIIHSFVIPRGLAVLASGKAICTAEDVRLEVKASAGEPNWGIMQAPFLQEKALTKAFEQSLDVSKEQLSYKQTSSLTIYGRDFEHTDQSELVRA